MNTQRKRNWSLAGIFVHRVILSEAEKWKAFFREVEESVPYSRENGSFDSPSTSPRVAQDDIV